MRLPGDYAWEKKRTSAPRVNQGLFQKESFLGGGLSHFLLDRRNIRSFATKAHHASTVRRERSVMNDSILCIRNPETGKENLLKS